MASAKCSRRCCPVDRSLYFLFSNGARPNLFVKPLSIWDWAQFANKTSASLTLICSGSEEDCSCTPIFPFIVICPLSYVRNPSMHSRVVVFPAPFTPRSAKISPLFTENETPFKTGLSEYCFITCSSLIAVSTWITPFRE
ncbi:hypothetical protein D3C73_1000060 [compost metagenome]